MSRAESPFDPFHFDDDIEIARSPSGLSRKISHTLSTTASTSKRTKSPALEGVREKSSSPRALPPRLNVRLTLHEEVSSTAVLDPDGEGGSLSQLTIEGKVMARVESSNAKENTPFSLQITGPMTSLANITCNDHCVLEDEDIAPDTVQCKVDIPKSEVAGCEILRYSMNVRTQNMPMLVQVKSSIVKSNTCRISVQIRSNLSNKGDLSNFTIIVAIPTTLRGETLKVTRGDHGVWDANKRIVTWKIGNLPHGESCLVSAEAEIISAVANLLHENPFAPKLAEDKIQCPVLVRCLSKVDQVSDLALSAKALKGVPATILQNQTRSYQLLHRVAGKN